MKTISIIALVLGGGVALYYLFFLRGLSFSGGAKPINKNISNQYYFKDNGVVFVRDANFFSLGAQEIEYADIESFEVLAYNLAKDKNHVYFDEIVLEHADSKTFEMPTVGNVINKKYTYHIYTKDATNVFHFHHQIKGADASSYNYLWGDYSRDDTNLYYRENKLIATTEKAEQIKNDVNENYIKIGEAIYFQTMLIEHADAASFKVIKDAFSKDKYAVYLENKLLKNIDPSSFKILDKHYQRDKNRLYYNARPFFNSHPISYEFINALFSKDKNNLYYIGRIVLQADPKKYRKKEVEKLDNDLSLINLIYDDDYTLFAKRNELKEISRIHHLYKNEVYCLSVRIIGADPKTFKVLKGSEEMYAVDNEHVYSHSQLIKNADVASFQAINDKFAKDKNYVYFFEKRLLDVNPKTFVYQEGMYGETIDEENDRLVYP